MKLSSVRLTLPIAPPSEGESHHAKYKQHFDFTMAALDLLDSGWVRIRVGGVDRLVPPTCVAWVTPMAEPALAPVAKVKR